MHIQFLIFTLNVRYLLSNSITCYFNHSFQTPEKYDFMTIELNQVQEYDNLLRIVNQLTYTLI